MLWLKKLNFTRALGIAVLALGLMGTVWQALAYVVQTGDTLSQIAAREIGSPIYGRHGSLVQLRDLNPQLKNENLIVVGDVLKTDRGAPTLGQIGEPLNAEPERTPASVGVVNEPAPEVAPELVKQPQPVSQPVRFGTFELGADFYSTKLLAEDASNHAHATLFSKSNLGIAVVYRQTWTEGFATELYFSRRAVEFSAPALGGTLNPSRETLYSFGGAASFQLASEFRLTTGLASRAQAYLIGVSANTVGLTQNSTLLMAAALDYRFLRLAPFVLGARVSAEAAAPSTFNNVRSNWNPGFESRLFVEQHPVLNSYLSLSAGLLGRYSLQNTNLTHQNATDYGVFLTLSTHLDSEPEKIVDRASP